MTTVEAATAAYTLFHLKDLHEDLERRKAAQLQLSRQQPGLHCKPEYQFFYRGDDDTIPFWENPRKWGYHRIKEAIELVKVKGAQQKDVERQPQFEPYVKIFRRYLVESDNIDSVFYTPTCVY